jgi:hypothetical protein
VQLVLYYTNHKGLGKATILLIGVVFVLHDTMIGSPLRREGYQKLILKGSHRTVGVMQRQLATGTILCTGEGGTGTQGSRFSVS